MLALNGTAALKGLGLRVQPAEGIIDAEGLGDAELELVDTEGRGGLGDGGGLEGGGGGDERGKEGELHVFCLFFCSITGVGGQKKG